MEHIVQLLTSHSYLILIPLVILEWPLVTLVAGFLLYTWQYERYTTLALISISDIISDLIHYRIWYAGRKFDIESKLKFVSLDMLKKLWIDHPTMMIFFGKLAYGISGPLIMSAGLCRVSLGVFLARTVPVTFVQASILLYVWYSLWSSYTLASQYMAYPWIIMLILFVLCIVWYIYATKRIALYAQKTLHEKN